MEAGVYRLILSIVAILLICPFVTAEKIAGDESNSMFSFTEFTYSNYYQSSYGYSPAYPPQDLGQYSDPISAINAYNQYTVKNNNAITTYPTSSLGSYQYISPQYNYQNDITMRTLQEISNPSQYQYITPSYGNQNDVTMRTVQEIQNPQQYQYITPTSPNLHCYKASPDAAEVCSY